MRGSSAPENFKIEKSNVGHFPGSVERNTLRTRRHQFAMEEAFVSALMPPEYLASHPVLFFNTSVRLQAIDEICDRVPDVQYSRKNGLPEYHDPT